MTPDVTESAVLAALKSVRDPDLARDIVSLGFVKDVKICGADVAFTLELTTPACPVRDEMKDEARRAVLSLAGVKSVNVRLTSQVRSTYGAGASAALGGIKNVVPVASGKGGVGKSTVSANLALALAATGAKVGLLDADVYGPSIPTIMGVKSFPTRHGAKIIPVEQYGTKIISTGFFMSENEAAILRGPMLHKMIEQFLTGVEWGELDYLVVDLPPGTGDVQLSLCQMVPLTGAVIVSTPQEVALRVAQKAVIMFRKLNCPVLGIIENMSHYVCAHCGAREEIFGSGGARSAAGRLGIPFLGEIPLATVIRASSDEGRPNILTDPASPLSKAFRGIAENMAAQISIRNMQGELSQDIKITF